MEILVTVAYVFLVRLVFFDYQWLRFNLLWKFVVFGLYFAAVLTEIVMLGQFTPYSKSAFVQNYVVQMSPLWGGLVKEVYVTPNVPIKKGDPLYQMDPDIWQYRVDVDEAQLTAADTDVAELGQQLAAAKSAVARTQASLSTARVKYEQIAAAAKQNAVSLLRFEESAKQVQELEAQLAEDQAVERGARLAFESHVGDQPTAVAEAIAELAEKRYNLEYTTIRAPSDGYVVNLQLHAGGIVPLKRPIMTFVSTDQQWLVATLRQKGVQRLAPGDAAEVAFDMYPGMIFPAVVESIAWANGHSQGMPSGQLPLDEQLGTSEDFRVRLRMTGDHTKYPVRFGAGATVAIYSSEAADVLKFLRQIEIQSESYLNYLYNPF